MRGRTRRGADAYVPGHGDLSYDVTHYDLELTYNVRTNHLDGHATLSVTAVRDLDEIALDLHSLRVGKVAVDGAAAKYSTKGDTVLVRPAGGLAAGAEARVRVHYSGTPRPVRSRSLGTAGWEELTDGVIVASQPHGAPSWFPCNDRPSSKATYRISITLPRQYTVVANGTLVERRQLSAMTRWVYEQAQPMAPYLATVQVGTYVLTGFEGAPVPVTAAVPQHLMDKYDLAFGRQVEMVTTFVRLFGDYPFDGYAVVVTEDDLEIPLESQSLSTFGANHLREDWDAVRLVAHELSHQWFGNSLTALEWKDIWLHEGFACYAEWLWSEAAGDRTAQEHAEKHWKRLSGLDQDLLLADPGPELMFDDRVYKRGALLLHALRLTVGDDAFFGLLRAWTAARAHQGVSTEMFVDFAEQHTGHALGSLFLTWLREEALPALPARG